MEKHDTVESFLRSLYEEMEYRREYGNIGSRREELGYVPVQHRRGCRTFFFFCSPLSPEQASLVYNVIKGWLSIHL